MLAIFPEAHIWPFYTGIRPFSATSFRYPEKLNAPVVAMVTTYRKAARSVSLFRRPGMTVTLSEPFYPRRCPFPQERPSRSSGIRSMTLWFPSPRATKTSAIFSTSPDPKWKTPNRTTIER